MQYVLQRIQVLSPFCQRSMLLREQPQWTFKEGARNRLQIQLPRRCNQKMWCTLQTQPLHSQGRLRKEGNLSNSAFELQEPRQFLFSLENHFCLSHKRTRSNLCILLLLFLETFYYFMLVTICLTIYWTFK